MASRIDATKPANQFAYTHDMRANFATAASEISALQAATSGGPWLPIAGGTLGGALTLVADPTTALQAATKQYVDAHISSGVFLPLSGGTINGQLNINGPGISYNNNNFLSFHWTGSVAELHVDNSNVGALATTENLTANYLALSGGTMSGPITLAADPATDMQPATRQYVLAHVASGVAGVASFNSRIGAVTLTSADVTAASGLLTTGGTLTGSLNAPYYQATTNGPYSAQGVYLMWNRAGDGLADLVNNRGLGLGGFLFIDSDGSNDVQLFSMARTGNRSYQPIVLPADPTTALQAATKQYVDAHAGGGSVAIAYTSPGTFSYADPGSGTYVGVVLYGGGGSGAGGAGSSAGVDRPAGSGGGGGAAVFRVFRRADLTFPVSVTVGAGGAFVSGGTTAGGTPGNSGGTTTFGTYVAAYGGGGGGSGGGAQQPSCGGSGGGRAGQGAIGITASAIAGGAPAGMTDGASIVNNIGPGGAGASVGSAGCAEWGGAAGGAAATSAAVGKAGGSSLYGGGGGGGGGIVNSLNTASSGGAGGQGNAYVVGGGPAGGAFGTNVGQGVAIAGDTTKGGQGGAGGGANASGPGFAGASGAAPGGGGGGGGGGVTTGGAGGAGGTGAAYIVAW